MFSELTGETHEDERWFYYMHAEVETLHIFRYAIGSRLESTNIKYNINYKLRESLFG